MHYEVTAYVRNEDADMLPPEKIKPGNGMDKVVMYLNPDYIIYMAASRWKGLTLLKMSGGEDLLVKGSTEDVWVNFYNIEFELEEEEGDEEASE